VRRFFGLTVLLLSFLCLIVASAEDVDQSDTDQVAKAAAVKKPKAAVALVDEGTRTIALYALQGNEETVKDGLKLNVASELKRLFKLNQDQREQAVKDRDGMKALLTSVVAKGPVAARTLDGNNDDPGSIACFFRWWPRFWWFGRGCCAGPLPTAVVSNTTTVVQNTSTSFISPYLPYGYGSGFNFPYYGGYGGAFGNFEEQPLEY
jgi:hypothetical protein